MSSQPFFEGDIWRGYITSCTAIRDRNKRTVHVPKHVVDFQVAKAETDGTTAFLYTEHTYGNQYYVQGVYDLQSFQITMEPGEWVKKNTKDFKRCSATAALSRDHGTLAGGVSCPHAPCVAGGGEFVLRHDRTAFRVSGAGRRGAEGEYRNLRPGQSPAHGLFFEGRPVFAQTTCDHPTAAGCGHHLIYQTLVNGMHFWLLALNITSQDGAGSVWQLGDQGKEREGAAVAGVGEVHAEDGGDGWGDSSGDSDGGWAEDWHGEEGFWHERVLYAAWSDEVTPPAGAWRVRRETDRPAPLVEPVVASLYAHAPGWDRRQRRAAAGKGALDESTAAHLRLYVWAFPTLMALVALFLFRKKRLSIPLHSSSHH